MDAWTMTRISHNREFRIFGGILNCWFSQFWLIFTRFKWRVSLFRCDLLQGNGVSITSCGLLSLRDDKYNFTKWAFTCPDKGFPQQIPAPRLEQELVSFPVQHNGMKEVEWEGGKDTIDVINKRGQETKFLLWNTCAFPAILTWYNWLIALALLLHCCLQYSSSCQKQCILSKALSTHGKKVISM